MTGQVMKRSGLPADGIPGLFDGSMSSFSSLLQVASANHLEVHLLLVLAFSLECTTFVLRHAQLLERRPLGALGAEPDEVWAHLVLEIQEFTSMCRQIEVPARQVVEGDNVPAVGLHRG